MNFFIYNPIRNSYWFDNIILVLTNSLKDLNHQITCHEAADVVIAIQQFGNLKRISNKKYILFQVEQPNHKKDVVKKAYSWGPDIIWGFQISNKKEIYTPLGYHKCLLDKSNPVRQDVNVSFFGSMTQRRKKLQNTVKYPFQVLNQWKSGEKSITDESRIKVRKQRLHIIKRSKINLNLNLYDYPNTNFTQWDRLSNFLANKTFFISEPIYSPFQNKIPMFSNCNEYNSLVDFYLRHPNEREQIAKALQHEYMTKFRMTDILKQRIEKMF